MMMETWTSWGVAQYDGVAWFENDGGFSSPVPAQIIDTDFSFSVFAIDLNLDGHMDVLSADFDGDKVSWFENDGAEGFTSPYHCQFPRECERCICRGYGQ
jgi:hypothetical protein